MAFLRRGDAMRRRAQPAARTACASFAVPFPWEPPQRGAGGGGQPPSSAEGLAERQELHGKPGDQRGPGLLLLTLGVVALALFLCIMLSALYSTQAHRLRLGVRCYSGLKRHSQGLWSYLVNNDRYFPPAWHVGGPTLAEDLSNLTFYRFMIRQYEGPDFSRLVSRDDVAHFGKADACKRKLEAIDNEWTDATKGWTQDWFAPEAVFRMPDPANAQRGRPVCYDDLLYRSGAIAADMPLLADVNAALPDPEARDPKDPEHQAEMRKGFSVVQAAGMNVFVGVGPSLRRAGDHSASRFDFRHQGNVNVLFLDGSVWMFKADEKARLEKIHRLWNSLEPSPDPNVPPR